MILHVVQLLVRPEMSDSFPFLMRAFTERTRAHTGTMWCTWTRNVENPDEYTLLEAFVDADSADGRARSDFFMETLRVLPSYLQSPPQGIQAELPAQGWDTFMDLPFFARGRAAAMGRIS